MVGSLPLPVDAVSTYGDGAHTELHDDLSFYVNLLAQEVYDVKTYGAVGDGVVVTGSMTSGSATLTADVATFTAADVGKSVRVAGAGSAGAQLNTTISGYTSGTQVTLAASAATTVAAAEVRYATDDSAAIAAAQTALGSSKSVLYFPPGHYLGGKVTLATGQWMVSHGPDACTYEAQAGLNDNVVESDNFASLTGTDTTATPYNMGIAGIAIDGNKGGQTSGTSNGVALYAYGYIMRDLRVRNCRSYGIRSEWATSSASPGHDSMEAQIGTFKVHDCDGGGIYFDGPHDTQFVNGFVYKCGSGSGHYGINVPQADRANGTVFVAVHVWGGDHDYAWRLIGSGITLLGCQGEGATVAQYYSSGSGNVAVGSKFFAQAPLASTVVGIVIDSGAGNNVIQALVEECGGGVADISWSSGSHVLDIHADYSIVSAPSPAILNGAVNVARSNITVNDGGSLVGDSLLYLPKNLRVDGQIGIGAAPNPAIPLLFSTGDDSHSALVIFGNSPSQSAELFKLQNSSFANVATFDKIGRLGLFGGSPTAAAEGSNGTSPPAPTVVSGSSDQRGRIQFGSGSGPGSGDQVTVTYSTSFAASPPAPQITACNAATQALGLYLTAIGNTGFTVAAANPPAASQGGTTYQFAYSVLG